MKTNHLDSWACWRDEWKWGSRWFFKRSQMLSSDFNCWRLLKTTKQLLHWTTATSVRGASSSQWKFNYVAICPREPSNEISNSNQWSISWFDLSTSHYRISNGPWNYIFKILLFTPIIVGPVDVSGIFSCSREMMMTMICNRSNFFDHL